MQSSLQSIHKLSKAIIYFNVFVDLEKHVTFFKRFLTDLIQNTGCFTKAKELSLLYNLLIVRGSIIVFLSIPRVLTLCET